LLVFQHVLLVFRTAGVASLSIDERLTIANMTTEWGALAGVFPLDETLIQWVERRGMVAMETRRGEWGWFAGAVASNESKYPHSLLALVVLDLESICRPGFRRRLVLGKSIAYCFLLENEIMGWFLPQLAILTRVPNGLSLSTSCAHSDSSWVLFYLCCQLNTQT
jgi:hypothetical protein